VKHAKDRVEEDRTWRWARSDGHLRGAGGDVSRGHAAGGSGGQGSVSAARRVGVDRRAPSIETTSAAEAAEGSGDHAGKVRGSWRWEAGWRRLVGKEPRTRPAAAGGSSSGHGARSPAWPRELSLGRSLIFLHVYSCFIRGASLYPMSS
jgi:hypothetical protein